MTRSHRSHSLLSLRPKTSSALDDLANHQMKRTASQSSFSQTAVEYSHHNMSEHVLDAVMEGSRLVDTAPSTHHHTHTSSLSRAGQSLKGSCKQICRRLSTSSRRPSLVDHIEESSASSSVPDAEQPWLRPHALPRFKLKMQHVKDSGSSTPTIAASSAASSSSSSSLLSPSSLAPAPTAPPPKFPLFKRLGSIRSHRRPATSGPSGDFARYNPSPAPVPSDYPAPTSAPIAAPVLIAPGQAARAAAAAANNERLHKLQRQEETAAYLEVLESERAMDEVLKDSESGVGMNCASQVVEAEDEMETRFDPVQYLPAEITTLVLSNLDAPSLIRAECVSRAWQEAANSPHVWKHVFLRRFKPEVHVSPTPIAMGGAGIGKSSKGRPAPGQDWKKMYKVRMTINRRWKGCSPSAIYLNGHTDSVYCCQFDESKCITGSRDRTIRVWDMNSYTCLKVIGGPAHRPVPPTQPELETHKETVISHPSLNGTPAGNAIYHIPSDYHEASILCLQYDATTMVTGSSDHTCIVWDISSPTMDFVPIARLEGHSAGVLDVALDAKHIVSCSKDATIIIWDRATFRPLRTLTGHRGPVNAVQLRGNLLVSASGDGVAKLWNLDSGVCVKEFPSQDRGLAAVEFSDDAKYVLAGGNDHVVYKFDASSGKLLHTSAKHGGLVRSLFLDANNGRVVSGSYDQSIRIADFATGEVMGVYENWTTSWILSAKSDYRRVVATSQDGRAVILDFGWGVMGKECLIGNDDGVGEEGEGWVMV